MKQNPTSKERHHWVPITYLNRFCHNGLLHARRIAGPKTGQTVTPKPKDICFEVGLNDLSRYPLNPKTPERLFEDMMCVIDRIYGKHAKECLGSRDFPNEAQTKAFGFFVTHQLFRSPDFKKLSHLRAKKLKMNSIQRETSDIFAVRAVPNILGTSKLLIPENTRSFAPQNNPDSFPLTIRHPYGLERMVNLN